MMNVTFEAYCKERWGFTRRHAYRFIYSVKVIENVTDRSQIQPANLEQTRPLSRLEPEQQLEVWKEAVETAEDAMFMLPKCSTRNPGMI